MKTKQLNYNIYPSLLDAYQQYVDSDIIWEKYWGFCETPPHTPEEFHKIQFQAVIDRINRVPYDNEAVAKGTAFNEVVDCMIEHRKSDKVEVEKVYEKIIEGACDPHNGKPLYCDVTDTGKFIGLNARIGERVFFFPIGVCREFANYYKGAVTQKYVEGILPTAFGDVKLYGFIDELLPLSVHDIKTASQYSVGKYKRNSQHLVYPFCLMQMGNDVRTFEYNVAVIGKYNYETFTESYEFVPSRDIPVLQHKCEDFIRFLEDNRELITDKKIFNDGK